MTSDTIDIQLLRGTMKQAAAEPDAEKRAAILDTISVRAYGGDPAMAVRLADEGLKICRSMKFKEGMAKWFRERTVGRSNMGDFPGALEDCAKACKLYNELGMADMAARARYNEAIVYGEKGDYHKAEEIFLSLLDLFREKADKFQYGFTLYALGGIAMDRGEYAKAMDLFVQSMHVWRDTGNKLWEEQIVIMLGSLYDRMGMHEKVLEMNMQFQPDTLAGGSNFANAGLIYSGLGELDVALEYFTQALEKDRGHPHHEVDDLALISDVHRQKNNMDVALRYCEEALEKARHTTNPVTKAHAMSNAAMVYQTIGRFAEAVDFMQNVLAIARTIQHRYMEYGAYEKLAMIYERAGDINGAFASYKAAVQIKNEIETQESKRVIAELQAKIDLDKSEREKELAVMKSMQLEQEISHKVKELSGLALSLQKRTEFLDKLKYRITAGMSADGDGGAVLRELLAEIAAEESTPQSYQEFAEAVDRSQENFNRTLSQRFPRLTAAELRICALLRGNMSTKEIADILCVTTRNVETHRYHIRQKMKLPKEASLIAFLVSL